MIIEESIDIKAPLPVVWRVFSAMEDWKSWNTVIENCCFISGDSMAENTCFTFQMRPYYLPSFRGPLLWLSKLIFIPKRLHRLTQQLMIAIKDQAEACGHEPQSN